jgi:hypothetical protein
VHAQDLGAAVSAAAKANKAKSAAVMVAGSTELAAGVKVRLLS